MTETAIELVHLRKSFARTEVLRDISLTIGAGEVVVVIGPSGSGKSTMLRCINFLEIPTGGTVKVLGRELRNRPGELAETRRKVGMVFQQFNLFPHMTVLKNVMEGPRTVLKLRKRVAEERAMALLSKVGVAEHSAKRASQLSGGQQQRVAIARALALEPQVMLFDEPTSSLDPELRAEVLDVMRQLAREGMTMMIVTHEMGFARKVADRVIFIDDGIIVEEGDPQEVLRNPSSIRLAQFLNVLFWGED